MSDERDYGDEAVECPIEAQVLGKDLPNYGANASIGSMAPADMSGLGNTTASDALLTTYGAPTALDRMYANQRLLELATASFGQNVHKRSTADILGRARAFKEFLKL